MKLSYKQCSIDNLETLILVSRKTFIDAFERQNNPEDFKQYMRQAFDKNEIKNQLLEYELIAEDLSGDTLMVEISAKTKKI